MTLKTALLAAAAVLAIGTGAIATHAIAQAERGEYTLPADVAYPEGVTYDAKAGVLYTAGAGTGAVTRVNVRTGAATIVAPPGVLVPVGNTQFPAILGMKIDTNTGLLWIAGGATGKMFVLDTKTGKLVKTLTTSGEGAFINDVTLTRDAAYYTDTSRPILWRVSRAGGKIADAPEAWIDYTKNTPVVYGGGAGMNGIAATPDGTSVLVVQMGKGLLFKVDTATKAVTQVDLKGQLLQGADGLWLDGHRLYAILQPTSEVVAIDLANDYASGTVLARVKNDRLVAPATAVKVGDRLLVANTQFNRRGNNTAVKPFSIQNVAISSIVK